MRLWEFFGVWLELEIMIKFQWDGLVGRSPAQAGLISSDRG